jgi:hypothetical protein
MTLNEQITLASNIKYALDGTTLLDPKALAIPCGSIAASIFSDKFSITGQTIDTTNLVDAKLKGTMYKNQADYKTT